MYIKFFKGLTKPNHLQKYSIQEGLLYTDIQGNIVINIIIKMKFQLY